MNEMRTTKLNLAATLATLGALACWSAGPIFIKYLAGYIDAWTQNFLRYVVALVFWLPFCIYSVRRGNIDGRMWKVALVPAVANVVMQCFWALAFYYIDPAFMNLLIKSSLIWIAVFSIIFFADERPLVRSPQFWTGLVLSVVGICGVLLSRQDFIEKRTAEGIVITLVAAFMWAVYTIAVRVAFRNYDSRSSFAVVTIYSTVVLAALGFAVGDVRQSLEMNLWQWACVVISGVVSIAFSHVFYYTAIKRIGATIPSMALLASPFFVLLGSNIVFGEVLSGAQVVFGLVLLGGSALAIWAQGQLGKTSQQPKSC
jgi:drug/metabolite transporter (DMT)-like permease